MAVELRMEERFAVEVLRRELNATFTQFDDNSAIGMVDGLFELPDGTVGALEVTTLTAPGAMQFEALTLGRDWSEVVDGVEWFWAIWVAPGLPLKAMEQHLGVVLRTAEAAGEHELERATWLGESASHRWMQDQELILHGYGSDAGKFPGLVQLIPTDHHGAFVQDGMGNEIGAWLQAELEAPALANKLRKLDATGRAERHLFLRVHESAPSDPLLHALCFSDDVPTSDLDPTSGLTGLWVAPRWGSALRWLAGQGWSRFGRLRTIDPVCHCDSLRGRVHVKCMHAERPGSRCPRRGPRGPRSARRARWTVVAAVPRRTAGSARQDADAR